MIFITSNIIDQLSKIQKKQIAVAQLEALGLPLRVVNMLEQYLGVIWLDELLEYTTDELKDNVPNLGEKGVAMIIDAIHRFDEIENANQLAAVRLYDKQLASEVRQHRFQKRAKSKPRAK